MTIAFKLDRFTDELFFLCRKAGFKTLSEILDYMQKEGITAQQLYYELDAICFPHWIGKDEI